MLKLYSAILAVLALLLTFATDSNTRDSPIGFSVIHG
jgi:hypothetical protein